MKKLLLSAICTVVAVTACGGGDGEPTGSSTTEGGAVAGLDGEQLFNENCALCHGNDLKGTSAGPPFLHEVYEPSHHPDESFFAAAANGVQAHHWDLGNMPPVPGITEQEVAAIVGYIREQQRAAGIE